MVVVLEDGMDVDVGHRGVGKMVVVGVVGFGGEVGDKWEEAQIDALPTVWQP